jgi:hypothetical protein
MAVNWLTIGLAVGTGVGSIILSSMNLRNLYHKWNHLREDPYATTTEKAKVIFDGTISLLTMGVGTAMLVKTGYNIRCGRDLTNLQDHRARIESDNNTGIPDEAAEIFNSYAAKVENDPALVALTEKRLCERYVAFRAEENHLLLNKLETDLSQGSRILKGADVVITGLQAVNAGTNIAMQFVDPTLINPVALVTATSTTGHLVYACYTKAKSEGNLPLSNNEHWQSYGLSLACIFGGIALECVKLPAQANASSSHFKEDSTFRPYLLPRSSNDPLLKYSKIPTKYHDRMPFKSSLCCLTQLPVTRALFVLENGMHFIFEKDSLAQYIFYQRSSGQSLINPLTKHPFFLDQVYESAAWNDMVSTCLVRMQEDEIEELRKQLNAVSM